MEVLGFVVLFMVQICASMSANLQHTDFRGAVTMAAAKFIYIEEESINETKT